MMSTTAISKKAEEDAIKKAERELSDEWGIHWKGVDIGPLGSEALARAELEYVRSLSGEHVRGRVICGPGPDGWYRPKPL